MDQEFALIGQNLKTPRAAAIAGIVFSMLSVTSQLLIRTSIPANPLGSATEFVQSFENHLSGFAPDAVCWHCLPVVHRCGPRPPREARRPISCDRVPRERVAPKTFRQSAHI
jgi:hypothetical protein